MKKTPPGASRNSAKLLIRLAPRAGFEPATIRLTVTPDFISLRCKAFHQGREVPYFVDFLALVLIAALQGAITALQIFVAPE
jgi:hypothetical protein